MTTKLIPTLRSLLLLTIAFTFALIANYAYGQWTPPTAPPPGNNVAAPLNVSSIDQTKGGAGGGMITAPVFRAADHVRSDWYCDYNGVGADNTPGTSDDNCYQPTDVGSGGSSGGSFGSCRIDNNGQCNAGEQLVGGGCRASCSGSDCPDVALRASQPNAAGDGWSCNALGANSITRYAICCTLGGGSSSGPSLPSCSNGDVLKYQSGNWVCGTDNTGGSSSSGPDEIVYLPSPVLLHQYAGTNQGNHVVNLGSYASNVIEVYFYGETAGGTTDTNGYNSGYSVNARPFNTTAAYVTISQQTGSGSNTGHAWINASQNQVDLRIQRTGSGGATAFNYGRAYIAGYKCSGACQ